MDNIKEYVMNYIEGRVSSKNFIKELKKNSEIIDWLQTIVPKEKIGYYDIITRSDGTWYQKTGPYNIKTSLDSIWKRPGSSPLGRELNTFSTISRLFKEAFPDIELHVDTTLNDQYNFLLEACPDYLNSVEISNAGILEKLMEEFPDTLPKIKRIKLFKQKIKTMFYLEGQKYPRWIQDSEWPLSKSGKATKFLRQKSKGEVCYYYFLDVDTGEEIEIMQAY